MKLWPFKRRVEEKASGAGPVVSAYNVGLPVWTPRDYANLAQEGFVLNPIAYRCVKLIASNAASVPWLLYSSKNEIEKHPLLDLLSKPADMQSGAALFEALYAYLLLAGNSYLEAVGPEGKAPKELWTLRPDRMKVVTGPYGAAAGYEYEHAGRIKRWGADPLTGNGEILHIKDFHPTEDWYGISRIEPASYAIDRHNAGSAHNKALLDNGARPSGALVFKPVSGGKDQPAQPVPSAVITEAEKRLTETHAGPVNAGKPFALGGDVNWLEMGITPRDMDFGAGMDAAARDICVAFGVPHILIVQGASTYNNVKEAKLELWEDTILPLVYRVTDSLNGWLAPRYAKDLRLAPDLDGIPALEPRREARRTSTIELYDKNLLTRDEAREALQYSPLTPEQKLEIEAKEKAEIALKKAQVFQIDVNSGVLNDDQLRAGRAAQLEADGTYQGVDMKEPPDDEEPIQFGDAGAPDDEQVSNRAETGPDDTDSGR